MSETTNETPPENPSPKPERELTPISPEEIVEKLANHAKWLEKVIEQDHLYRVFENFPDDLKHDPQRADFSFRKFPEKYDLSKRDLRYADFTSADFSWANLTSADLTFANLTSANLTSADFSGAMLDFANLSKATLTSSNLSWATLTFADLSWATLIYANLSSVTLTYADLRGVKFGKCVRKDNEGNDAKNEDWKLVYNVADLSNAKFNHAELSFTEFYGINLAEADFSDARFEKAVFKECDITRTDFTRADFTSADLETVKWIETARFSQTKLTGAKLPPNTNFLRNVDVFAESSKQNKRLVWLVSLASAIILAMGLITQNGGEIKLTMMGVSISTEWYLFFAPIIASIWFIYTQFNLLLHWELVAGLPSILPNGLPVFHQLHPWFPNQLISLFFANFPNKGTVRKVVQYLIIGAILWFVPIGSLCAYPWLVKHESFPYDTMLSLHIVNLSVLAASVVGLMLIGRTYTILKGLKDPVWHRIDEYVEDIIWDDDKRFAVLRLLHYLMHLLQWMLVIIAGYEMYVLSHWLTYYQLR